MSRPRLPDVDDDEILFLEDVAFDKQRANGPGYRLLARELSRRRYPHVVGPDWLKLQLEARGLTPAELKRRGRERAHRAGLFVTPAELIAHGRPQNRRKTGTAGKPRSPQRGEKPPENPQDGQTRVPALPTEAPA